MTTTPTPEASREAVAAAIEAAMPDLVTALAAAYRGMELPEPLIAHLASTAGAILASSFGSGITDEEIRQGGRDALAVFSGRLAELLAPTAPGSTVAAWVVGAVLRKPDEDGRGFAMLTDRFADFEHAALGHEIVARIAKARN